MKLKALKAAFPYTIPVLMGYIFMGIAFGILLRSKGYDFGWAILMSTFIYAGSMQFVAVNILCNNLALISIAFITFMINSRHLFYGLSMLKKFRDMGRKKIYMIFSLTDETFSLLSSVKAPVGVNENWFYFFIALLDHSYWITGSAIGGILGNFISFNTKGIDFVMTALFTVIFIEQWKSSKNHWAALIGILVSVLCLFIFGTENFILPAMILILASLTLLRKIIEKRV